MREPDDDQARAQARRIQMALYVLTFVMVALPVLIFWLRHVKD
jgi:hypothetical protein